MGDTSRILEEVQPIIMSVHNAQLLKDFTGEEVFDALKGMGPTKAPGIDGFPVMFFQKFWSVVGNSIISYCLSILNEGKEVVQSNKTSIVLLPKIQSLINLANFLPINFCLVIYKIIANAIANRLQGVIG